MEEKNNSHWPILRSLLRSIQDKASKSIRGTNDRILISKHNNFDSKSKFYPSFKLIESKNINKIQSREYYFSKNESINSFHCTCAEPNSSTLGANKRGKRKNGTMPPFGRTVYNTLNIVFICLKNIDRREKTAGIIISSSFYFPSTRSSSMDNHGAITARILSIVHRSNVE